LAKRVLEDNSNGPDMNSKGPSPRVRFYGRIWENSRTAKTKKGQRKEIKSMKNRILVAILPVLACFALLSGAQGQLSPPPDGCYPNFTTAEGCNALNSLTTGSGNSGLGWFALSSDTTGSFNTGVGGGALALTTGDSNTAVGAAALLLNTSGSNNTAVGTDALVNNTVDDNTAAGFFALGANTIGGTLETSVLGFALGPNTAVGSGALENNVDSSANTAVGYNALNSQTTGLFGDPHLAGNTAVGFEALANVTGSMAGDNFANTALGYQALFDLADGNSNVAVGFQSGFGLVTGDNNIYIGAFQGTAGVTTEFSHTHIQNIGSTILPAVGTVDFVTVDTTSNLLGHNSSSRRYKEDIKPMENVSDKLYRLKPVTFRYKKDLDPTRSLDYGLIAEDVAEVDPSLAVHDGKGQIENVRYNAITAMLLNEFLKEHKKVEEQQASISQLKGEMQTMVAQLKEQAAQIQKVSAQFEVNKPAPKVVVNKP
jgi:hypothetical protein